MIDRTTLRRLAGRWRVPLGIVEKDLAITVALGAMAVIPSVENLAFKGGTALRKAYFRDYRFSEDLDFTAKSDVSADILEAASLLRRRGEVVGVTFEGIESIPQRGRTSRTLKVRYRDMNGHRNSITVQLSLRERVALPPERRLILDPYGVLTESARVPTMLLPEILAEKIRALHMRSEARDLYDIWKLLGDGVRLDRALVERKLQWWRKGERLNRARLEERILLLERVWERDTAALVPDAPPFGRVAQDVLRESQLKNFEM